MYANKNSHCIVLFVEIGMVVESCKLCNVKAVAYRMVVLYNRHRITHVHVHLLLKVVKFLHRMADKT